MNDYPVMIATVGHVEPVPRRIRGYLAAEKALGASRALIQGERLQRPWEIPWS